MRVGGSGLGISQKRLGRFGGLRLADDLPTPAPPQWPVRCYHARSCPEHGTLLDDDAVCPEGHSPAEWYVVAVRPDGQYGVCWDPDVERNGKPAPKPMNRRGLGCRVKLSRRTKYLAETTWRLRRAGFKPEQARRIAEQRWQERLEAAIA